MNTTRLSFLLAGIGLSLLAGCQTAGPKAADPNDGRVAVTFQSPEKFTDFKSAFMDTDRDREDLMALLRDFLNREARLRLADGQKLAVTFTDIDLAGDFLPMVARGHPDIRVITEVYPPRMKLHFVLTDAAGTVVKEGDRAIDDFAFMTRVTPVQRESLRYEYELLRDWLRNELR